MTLKLRNILMIILSFVSVLVTLTVLFGFIFGLSVGYSNLNNVIPMIIISLFTTIYCFSVYFSFRNTISFEIFFYFLFVFSLLLDIFKLDTFFNITESFWPAYPMLTTRLIYYGRFAGTLFLVCSGLFATGLEYQRIGITALLAILLPAILVIVIPVDISITIAGGTYGIGEYKEIFVSLSVLSIIAILNFIIAGIKNENRGYFIIALILSLSIAGRELSFYSTNINLKICAIFLLSLSSILVSHRIHKLYLWH